MNSAQTNGSKTPSSDCGVKTPQSEPQSMSTDAADSGLRDDRLLPLGGLNLRAKDPLAASVGRDSTASRFLALCQVQKKGSSVNA
jgi:hypothetical protein